MDTPHSNDTLEPPNKKIKRIDQVKTIGASSAVTRGSKKDDDMDVSSEILANVDLSPAEQLLRKLLLDCRDSILSKTTAGDDSGSENNGKIDNQNDNAGLAVAATATKSTSSEPKTKPEFGMWFVGGWVRDKLLGKQSSDIDVALSAMTGSEFARRLKDFLSENNNADMYKEEAARQGVLTAEIRGFHQIDRNPGKGKHLETTSAQIFGLDVDFVNLRKESTHQDSKTEEQGNEQIKTTTTTSPAILAFNSAPEEDAFRRDANVNAIFYNLETQRIEDYTKKGLIDIQAKVLRTPLDARITFTDDPLRVLRLIRLASTLGFTIGYHHDQDDNTQQAIKDSDIQLALRTRISRERIGSELKKMMIGPDPATAFRWIYELHLYGAVFLDFQQDGMEILSSKRPEVLNLVRGGHDPDHPWPSTWLRACVALAELWNANDDGILTKEIIQSEDREAIWQMAAWVPLAQLRRGNNPGGVDDGIDIDGAIVKAATKAVNATSKKAKLLSESFKNMDSIKSTIDEVNRNNSSSSRSTVGVAIRSWGVTWKLQALYSLLSELVTLTQESQQQPLLTRYSTFLRFVSKHSLQEAPTTKPILNGGDIKNIFGLKKSGPFMKDVFEAVLRWQFDHITTTHGINDNGSIREEAIAWLRTQKARLNIPDAG